MNKKDYLDELRRQLRRLPQQEIDDALEYYTEYLEEAGPENEAAVLEELGSPKELARKIIIEAVDKEFSRELAEADDRESEGNKADAAGDKASGQTTGKASGKGQDEKKSHNSIWIILLAILAIPMSPVLLILLAVVFIVLFALVVALLCIVLGFGAVVVGGVLTFIVGIVTLFINPGIGLVMSGLGLVMTAVSILMVVVFFKLTKLLIKGIRHIGGSIVHRKAGKKA